MNIIMVSNRLTPHQIPLANALNIVADFKFYETMRRPNSLPVGWSADASDYQYAVTDTTIYQHTKKHISLIEQADVVIYGSAPFELIKPRLRKGKLTFRYSERIYKQPCPKYELPLRALKYYWQNDRFKNHYLLCASAFTAGDYAKTGNFIGRAFKWGYFPEVKRYGDIDALIAKKKPASILWAGRLIGLKHPEASILVAEKLRQAGYNFELNIIGNGEMEQQLRDLIQSKGLGQQVHMLGSMPPEQVREYMEESEIFLFTSDRNEGWGAVLNESMNSGCAVVASHEIGSVPFLIRHNENGLVYECGNTNELFQKVTSMLDSKEVRARMGKMAYETMVNQWNAENAAQRLLRLAQAVLDGGNPNDLFADGVCSPAKTIK